MQDLQQERQLFFSSIAIRNASDDIQVFNEMFVSCYVHSCVITQISEPECAISSFSEYILCAITSFHLR